MNLHKKLTGIAIAAILFCNITACNDAPEAPAIEEPTQPTAQPIAPAISADTINKPGLVKAETDGALRLTAQNGAAIGPEIKYMPEWRAFGWFTAADRVEWDVDVAKAGEYEAFLDWSVSNEEAGKEFLLEAADQKLTGTIAPSGSWETYKTEKIGAIKLAAGRQKIIFRSNKPAGKGALLDLREVKLVFSK